MHKVTTVYRTDTTSFLQQVCRDPFGPQFPKSTAAHAIKMEVWGSSFNDAGEDFCEFRLFNENGTMISKKRKAGF